MNFNIGVRLFLSFCVVLFFTFKSAGASQQEELDSLDNILKTASTKDSIDLLSEKGKVYYKYDDNIKAIELFYKALQISSKINDDSKAAALINNIAAVYYATGDLESALSNFIKSYELELQQDNPLGVSKSLNNIAIIYNELERYDESLDYYNRSLEIREELGDEMGISTVHNNIGLVFIKKKEYEKAIEHYNQSLEISLAHNSAKSIANTYANIGRAYFFLGDYNQARINIEKSFEYANEVHAIYIIRDNYLTLYEIYKKTNSFQEALENYEKFDIINDSLNSIKINANFDELKVKYESEKNERENILLKSERDQQKAYIRTQNIIVVGIALVLVLVSVLAFMMYKNSRIRKKSYAKLQRQKEEIENKNLELRKLNQIKNKIFSVISHEVRSPLNSLLGTVELLTSGYLSPEEFFELSTDLKQKVNHTTIFLNNILLWAKSQMHGMVVNKEDFTLNELVDDIYEMLKEQADMKGVEIERNIDEDLLVKADRNMIGIVVKNLISNAIKFTEKGQKVSISSNKNGNFATINVTDEGVGIPEENKSKVFGDANISTKGTAQEIGTGLGLTLSRNFVEENGGKIWLESEEGKGSTFSFTIPLN